MLLPARLARRAERRTWLRIPTSTARRRSTTVSGIAIFVLRACAERDMLHPDTASPDDPNEISFAKGELLDILDKNGKWWQARKADGTVGSGSPRFSQPYCSH